MRTADIKVGGRYRLEESYGRKGEVEVVATGLLFHEGYSAKKNGVRVRAVGDWSNELEQGVAGSGVDRGLPRDQDDDG